MEYYFSVRFILHSTFGKEKDEQKSWGWGQFFNKDSK